MNPETVSANWNYPTSISFGPGKIDELSQHCQRLNFKKPLLVTDPFLITQPFMKDILSHLETTGLSVNTFSEITANPTVSEVKKGANCFREGQHDSVITLGGGSPLDAGKAIAFIAGQSHHLLEFEDIGDNYLKADTNKIAPILAIPTAAGTGSEVGRSSVILDEDSKQKKIIFHPKMMPIQVIADPTLTLNLPPHLTAATGMDAFVHNLEAYCSPGYHPMAEGIALKAMSLIKAWLPTAYQDGQNLEARSHMLASALMGATAFQKGLGGVHSLAHPIGAIFNKPHGLLNAILLPYVLKFNQSAINDKAQQISAFLNITPLNFEGLFDWILSLRQQLEIPNTLSDIDVTESYADEIAQAAINDPTCPSNPRPLSVEQLKQIYLNAVRGNYS